MVWYGAPGSGKGYQLKVYLSREHFANGLRIYGIDQDEQQEYAGRFCDYLGGRRVPIRTLAEAEGFHFIGVNLGPGRNDDVVIWDLHESDETERGLILAELKRQLCAHLVASHGGGAVVVDAAVTGSDAEPGRRARGDADRRR